MAKPDRNLVDRISATFSTAEDVDYFFDQLKSPDWIEPLASADFFKYPPEPHRVDGGVQFPPWSASRYLARMADISPELVKRTLLNLPDTKNVRVLYDILVALIAMPPELAAEFTPRIVSWFDNPFHLLLPEKVTKLIRRFALAGMGQPALTLAASLFRIHSVESFRVGDDDASFEFPTEPLSNIDSYEFERSIGECREDLIKGSGLNGLEFLSDLLSEAMRLEVGESEGSARDYSWIWRPAIEPHSQDWHPGVRDSIVSAVRDAAVQLVSTGQAKLSDVLYVLESRKWSVLRRVALHVIRETAPLRSASVSSHLTESSWIFDSDLHHEYWMLLHDRFERLSFRQQGIVMKRIKQGPDIYHDSSGPFGDDPELALECWQVGKLSAIANHLSGESKTWFENLVAKGLISEHPEFLSYVSGTWIGPTSPISESEFAAMTNDELIDFLQTWEPEPGWAKPTPEGLGRALEAAVRADPTRFSTYSARLRFLDPTYVNAILSAFREVARNGETLDWKPVLQLAEWVVKQDRVIPNRTSEYSDLDPGWVWTRRTIAHLLDIGFSQGSVEIPFELRQLAWSVLRPLTDDPDPSVESEAKYGGANMDPSNYAINTVRGQSIESVVMYALWVHRQADDSDVMGGSNGFDRMPEVREVLDQHLNLSAEPSYAVHSIYGQWLPWLQLLDPGWTEHNLSRIFPPDDAAFLFWEAAWDAYVSFCPPYDSVFDLVKKEYGRAVTRIVQASPDRKHPMLGLDRLAQHLITFYLRGRLALDDPLLERFYREAPSELRASALRFAGRSFYSLDDRVVHAYENPEPAVIERAIALWAARLNAATQVGDVAAYRDEISEFGWWFMCPTFDVDWALTQLQLALRFAGFVEFAHMVVKRLAEIVDTRPVPVLTALQLLISSDSQGFLSLGWNSVTDILRSALSSSQIGVRQHAETLTHELGARGYRNFRDLLRETK